jgi:hypothetical protein
MSKLHGLRRPALKGLRTVSCLLCRLLSRANSIRNRLYTEAYGCGRKGGSRQMQRCLDSIQDVLAVLSSYRCAGHSLQLVRYAPVGQHCRRLHCCATPCCSGSKC